MKSAAAVLVLMLLVALPLHFFFTPRQGFNAAVFAVEQQYHSQPQTVPLLWFASLCAAAGTGGGVRNLRIANFHHIHDLANPDSLATLLSTRLSSPWQRILLNRQGTQQLNIIYVRPEGHAMRLLIANYDHGQLNLVRMDLNGRRLTHFLQNPAQSAHHHNTVPD